MLRHVYLYAEVAAASEVLKTAISPLFGTMATIAGIVSLLFLVFGGYYYVTSRGNPEKLERAKKTLRGALIGLVVVLGASTLVGVMQHAYSTKSVQEQDMNGSQAVSLPDERSFNGVVNQAIAGFIQGAVTSIGKPVVETLKQFTTATPLMAQNGAVFNVWVVIVAIMDGLFFLVVAILGFKIMSVSAFGFEEVDLRSLAPQAIAAFIVANLSIFGIDALISISNAMIHALLVGVSAEAVWTSLLMIIGGAATLSLGVLLMLAFLVIVAIALLIYYLKRLVILHVGAVLSPLVILMWLLPGFREFAVAAMRRYVTMVFVLFVHVVILVLAVAVFAGVLKGDNPFMACLVGIATVLVLLGTGRELDTMAVTSSGNASVKNLGMMFVRSASHVGSMVRSRGEVSGSFGLMERPRPTSVAGVNSGGFTASGAGSPHEGASYQGTAARTFMERRYGSVTPRRHYEKKLPPVLVRRIPAGVRQKGGKKK